MRSLLCPNGSARVCSVPSSGSLGSDSLEDCKLKVSDAVIASDGDSGAGHASRGVSTLGGERYSVLAETDGEQSARLQGTGVQGRFLGDPESSS